MRITMFLLLFSVIQVMAKSSYSQSTKLSLNLNDVSIEHVLDEIENQSEFYFLYNQKLVNVDRKVNVNTRNKKISTILTNLFEGYEVNCLVMDRQIVLSPKNIEERVDITRNRLAQELIVTGTVTDENEEPLPGLSIVIKGTSIGTVTNLEGKYTIEVVDPLAVLVFSFVGYMTQEVTVGEQTVINISLEQDILGLEEVVVIGYGTQKKSDLTGTLTRVNTEKTNDLPNINILQSLKGSVAGLSIGTPDQAGEEPTFQIRGINSLSAGNNPLIVVDGTIYWGSLNNLNTNDIKSVDVLKDASAAAVYGSRSANGVIIITTKKGTSEKPVFNFNANYGVSNPVYMAPLLSPDQYIQMILDVRTANGHESNPDNIHDYLTITESNNLAAGKSVDWYDVVKTSNTQNYTGSVSGSTDKTNYFISGSYFGQEGIVENDNFERITARANFSNKITDWFTLSVKSSFSNLDYSGVEIPIYWMLSPYSNWYEDGADSGELEYYPSEDPLYRHPYLNFQIDDHDVRNDLWGLVSSEIKVPFVKGLKWTLNYSLNQNIRSQFRFDDNTLAITENGAASKTITDFFTWTFDNILNYNRVFNDVHQVDATMLISREYLRASSTSAAATNFFSQGLGYNSLELGTVPFVSSGYGEQNQTALMGRVNYMYRNTYALTGTVRRDGFSGFAEGNKYAMFYSGAFAWTLSNESFMQNISWLDLMKLRVSYGENGNQAIGRYQTLSQMNSLSGWVYPGYNYVFGDGGGTSNGVSVTTMANSDLGWETTKVFNLGLDFGLFNSLLYGNIDLYSSNTEDVLLERNIPSLTGFQTIWTNIGQVQNQGVELSLNARPVRKNDFTWDIGCIFSLNRNSIVSLFGVDHDEDGVEDDDIANSWFIGEPLGVIYDYGVDGIHQTGDSDIPVGYQPGDFRIIDYDGDGELSADDRHILGNNIPNYQFSISNTFKYKNLSLYILINSIQGGGKDNYYMANNSWAHNPQGWSGWTERFNIPYMDYWTPTNPSNTAARITYMPTRKHPFLEDRSFIRIQDVILSYSFDNKLLNRLQIEGLRVYASGKNLLTFSEWNGSDPENASGVIGRPMMRTFTFGVDFKF